MTPQEKQKLEIYKKAFEIHKDNPELTYEEIGRMTGIRKVTVGAVVRRFREIAVTKQPFFKPRAPKTRGVRGGYKRSVQPAPLNPRVNNPDDLWKAAFEAGAL